MKKFFQKYQKERRQYPRYGSKDKVSFSLIYDVQTKIKYQIVFDGKEKILSKKYSGVSCDLSAAGLCFTSSQQLQTCDILRIEVYVSGQDDPVVLNGEVRWSKAVAGPKTSGKYESGVKLLTVNKKSVMDTIHTRKDIKIIWSDVLNLIIGDPKKLIKK